MEGQGSIHLLFWLALALAFLPGPVYGYGYDIRCLGGNSVKGYVNVTCNSDNWDCYTFKFNKNGKTTTAKGCQKRPTYYTDLYLPINGCKYTAFEVDGVTYDGRLCGCSDDVPYDQTPCNKEDNKYFVEFECPKNDKERKKYHWDCSKIF